MFLVTTADQRSWKTDEKILFLGEWCRLYQDKSVWSGLDAEILPYHWDDREKLRLDYIYLQKLYEHYLSQLSARLNELHGEDHSTRYWRIIIGPWLYYFIGILYDRYSSICSAIRSQKVTNTWLPSFIESYQVPESFYTFQGWNRGDEYNHYLYGRIIEALGELPYEIRETPFLSEEKSSVRGFPAEGIAKRTIRKVLQIYGKMIPARWNRVVFINSYLNPKDLMRLQRALGQLPYPCAPLVVPKKVPVIRELRNGLKLTGENNRFENLLQKIIPDQIPTAYIENYLEMRRSSLGSFPRKPRVIYTANALLGSEGFTFWIATQVERGTKLVASQHGGHYGSAAWTVNESHEKSVSDRYFSWGWKESGQPQVVPFPSGQLAGLKPMISPNPSGKILWVDISFHRYSAQLMSCPRSRQTLDYLKDQERFGRAVLPEVHKLLVKRIFPMDFGWNEELRWPDIDPELKIYHGRKTMYEQLNECRLCVGTYNSTTDLETLSRNYPTIIFFNPDHWELRESAQPFFDDLRRVGIYHTTPESAAAKVNEVYEDPQLWWNSDEVQKVRGRFCHQFARTSKTWIAEWKKAFQNIIEE